MEHLNPRQVLFLWFDYGGCERTPIRPKREERGLVLYKGSTDFAHLIYQLACFSARPSWSLFGLFLRAILVFQSKETALMRVRGLSHSLRRTFLSRTLMIRPSTGVYRSRRPELGNLLPFFSIDLTGLCDRKSLTRDTQPNSLTFRPMELNPCQNFQSLFGLLVRCCAFLWE